MWLIDVGLPRVLRRRTALPTPRAPDGCVDDSVSYRTQTLTSRIIDLKLTMLTHVTYFRIASRFSLLSSIFSYRIVKVKVTEEVALHPLDWARMFS